MKPFIPGTIAQRRIRAPGRGLHGEITGFCRALRRSGLKITSPRIVDLFRSIDCLDVTRLEHLYIAAKANLVSSQEEIALFDTIFRLYWFNETSTTTDADAGAMDALLDEDLSEDMEAGPGGEPQPGEEEGEGGEEAGAHGEEGEDGDLDSGEPGGEEQEEGIPSYSPAEVLAHKDFSTFEADQIIELRRLIAKLVPKLATKLSRRKKSSMNAREIDLRRSVKRSIRTGGEVLHLYRRRRKIQKTQLVLLCDVSGSMDSYSQFLIQFLYSLQNEVKAIRTFVFSTRLTDATPYLRHKNVNIALSRLAEDVHDWSGGTQIGNCLRTFNFEYGRQILTSHSIVLIISDGWDRGDTEILAAEMERLKKKAHKLIWLNPLLGSPGYRPIDRGMRTALPYCDEFLAAHNLDSLVEMTHRITKM